MEDDGGAEIPLGSLIVDEYALFELREALVEDEGGSKVSPGAPNVDEFASVEDGDEDEGESEVST